MTTPLDAKGLEAAHDAFYATESSNSRDMMRNAIRAYLSTTPAPDGLEDLLRDIEDEATFFDRVYAPDCATSKTLRNAATHLSQAQSALAVMRVRVEELETAEARIKALEEALHENDPSRASDVYY